MAEEDTTGQPAKNQNPVIVFLIFIIVIGLLALAFFFGLKYRQTPGGVTPTPTPEVTNVPSPQPTPTPTPAVILETTATPTVEEINPAQEAELIKQAVFKKTGLTASQAEVTINKNTGQHATGNIKEFEAVGGAYWLAAKTAEGWVCVYDGQSQPTCEQIAPYNFPKDMVPECLDKDGKVVKR
jgi:cytoskeletal protein RodZ